MDIYELKEPMNFEAFRLTALRLKNGPNEKWPIWLRNGFRINRNHVGSIYISESGVLVMNLTEEWPTTAYLNHVLVYHRSTGIRVYLPSRFRKQYRRKIV
jgi:hypothetical protein